VKKRGKDTWLVSVFLGLDAAGKRRYSAKTIKGKRSDAEKFLRARLAELDRGEFVEPSAETLNAYLDYWLESAAKPKLAIRTYEDYEYRLALYVRPVLGLKKLSALQPREIQALYSDMLKRDLSSRSVRAVHTILSSALKQAVKWGMLAVNPATACELPRKER